MENKLNFRNFSIALIWVWLSVFAIIPLVLILIASFLSHTQNQLIKLPFTLINYQTLLHSIYAEVFFRSGELAFTATIFCLAIAYPFAYIISRLPDRTRSLALIFVIIPFWTSSLIRTYAMLAILKAKGILNSFLLALGIIHQPLEILYSNTAVLIGLVYALLPFMILPIYANLEKLDMRLIEAAKDLGANRLTIMRKIILPLSIPGIAAGCMLVFLPAMTLFYIPVLLGGAKSMLLGNLIETQFLHASDWPLGSATSVFLVLLLILILLIVKRFNKKDITA